MSEQLVTPPTLTRRVRNHLDKYPQGKAVVYAATNTGVSLIGTFAKGDQGGVNVVDGNGDLTAIYTIAQQYFQISARIFWVDWFDNDNKLLIP